MDEQLSGVYTQWNIIRPKKEKEFPPFTTTSMNLEGIILSKITQLLENGKYCMTSLICGIRKQKTKQNKKCIETEDWWLSRVGMGK